MGTQLSATMEGFYLSEGEEDRCSLIVEADSKISIMMRHSPIDECPKDFFNFCEVL
jgi:hypothetical protein